MNRRWGLEGVLVYMSEMWLHDIFLFVLSSSQSAG